MHLSCLREETSLYVIRGGKEGAEKGSCSTQEEMMKKVSTTEKKERSK